MLRRYYGPGTFGHAPKSVNRPNSRSFKTELDESGLEQGHHERRDGAPTRVDCAPGSGLNAPPGYNRLSTKRTILMSRQQAIVESTVSSESQSRVWDAFRRWGYLQANLDPLGDLQPVKSPELDVQGADADAAHKIYCGTIGVEFMHIPEPERRAWIEDRM